MRAYITLWLGMLPIAALAACTANEQVASSGTSVTSASASAEPVPGGSARWGSSIGTMAEQYNRPHPGPVAAAGASAWVPPAPAPAFAIKDLPPAPAPAAGNRAPAATPAPQPAARPAVDAANIVRLEADTPAPAPAATLSAATREAGRKLFNQYSCGACHALADAGASGAVGPGLDRNPRLSKDYVVETLKIGRGAMPSFDGQMTDAEMATLAEYIVGASRK